MKKIILQLMVIMALTVLVGCSTDNDVQDLQELEQISVKQIFNATKGFIYNGTDKKMMNKFQSFNDDELLDYFHLISKRMISNDTDFPLEGIETTDEMQKYFYNMMLAIHNFSKEHLNKNYNELSQIEVNEIIDNNGVELFDGIQKETINNFEKKGFNFDYLKSDKLKKANCSGYDYYIPTYITFYGSRNCSTYKNATYTNDSDCDYEFCFPYSLNYTPSSLGLRATKNGVRRVLLMGDINGRIINSDVRFLIGKGRIRYVAWMSPNTFKNNLKGNW